MTRNGLTALAATAVLALGAAGCGGDDKKSDSGSNKQEAYSAFVSDVNNVCKEHDEHIDSVSGGLTGEAANDAPIYDELIPKLEDAFADFNALDPPEELQATFDEAKQQNDQQLTLAKSAQTAAEAGDQAEYEGVIAQLQQLSKESDLTASKLGAAECISD